MEQAKPGDTLIITELWAAAAAHKLGFEGKTYVGARLRPGFHFSKNLGAAPWRITVTKTGPNAAERFLPMAGDDCKFKFNSGCLTVEEEWKWVKRSNERFGFLVRNYFLWFQRIVERHHNGEMVPFPNYKIEGQLGRGGAGL